MPSQETPTTSGSSRFSKKWIWGAVGIASALALGVTVSRRGLPLFSRKEKPRDKATFPTSLTAEWQLIEKIDRALQAAHIQGIDVYVKNGKVLLVTTPAQQHDLLDARDLILTLDGVQSVETSVKSSSEPSPTVRKLLQ